MLTQSQIELIHREIDGANTPEEGAAFRSLIESHPEARALATDLRQVSELFDRVGIVEPPGRLRRAILDALARQVPVIPRWGVLKDAVQSIVEGFQKRPRFALVSSLCVGLVAGFGLYAAVAGTVGMDRSNTSGLTGTIAELPVTDGLHTVNEIPIIVDGVSGRVRVRVGRTAVVVELESKVDRPLEVRLTFREGAFGLRGFSQLRSDTVPSFSSEPGLIRVTTSGGNTQTFVLDHEGPVSPLALSLLESGEEVFATTLLRPGRDEGG